MTFPNTPRPRRRPAFVAASNLCLFASLLIVISGLLVFSIAGPAAAEMHPEAFAGRISARTNGQVTIKSEPGTRFGREENLWVYQKRYAIQSGGVTVKVSWTRTGKVRVESFEADSAKALIVEELPDSQISVGDEVGRMPNAPPRIISILSESTEVRPRHEIILVVEAVDDKGDQLFYEADITGGTLYGMAEQSPIIRWIAPPHAGTYWITVRVSDSKGATTEKRIAMDVSSIYEADPYKLAQAIGGNSRTRWRFGSVTDIAMDSADNMWVLDGKSRMLRVRGLTGAEIGAIDLTFGVSGGGISPSRICLAPDDSLYVLDIQHTTLQKLDRTGKPGSYVFSPENREEFLLERPSDLECANGDVLVIDSASGHVTVIDADGRFVLLFAARGSGVGQLFRPISITTNEFGDIFVLDSAKEEIIEFDRGYRFRAQHSCLLGGETGDMMADARTGSVLALDGTTGSVKRLDADGELDVVVSPPRGRGSVVPAATSMALRSDGHILVGTENASVWEYDREGVLRGILGEEDFGRVPDIAVSDDGQLFVLDASISQVDRFGRHGWLKGRFGAKGKYEGRFTNPARICVDGEGNCYVFDDGANTIQKFYATGVFAKALPISDGVAGGLRDAVDIDVAANGDVYILDAKRKAVFVVTREGELRRIVPLTSSDARQSKEIRKPRHISLDPDGYIYVSDPSAYAVYRFHPDGTRVNKLGGKGREPGMFGKIADLEADGQGYVYVLLKDRRLVSKFNSDGRFITEIPLGIDNDNPSKTPECIAVDSYGALYTFDNYYKSVLKFMQ